MTTYDVVLTGGRVIDPETGLDAVRDVGIAGRKVVEVSPDRLDGTTVVRAEGLVVCPGFIDLHSHPQTIPEQRVQALDGVTTALELEGGRHPVEEAYRHAALEGRPLHYGFSASWATCRMRHVAGVTVSATGMEELDAHIGNKEWQGPASEDQVSEILESLGEDLAEGAIGIGVLLGYAQDSGPDEYLAVAGLAAAHGVPTFTHARDVVEVRPTTLVDGAHEIVRAAAETGAAMHYCHVNSTSTRHVDRVLGLVERVRAEGAAVSTEAYPYGAGMTSIGAMFIAPERLAERGLRPQSLCYLPTGERVADVARLEELRREDPGGLVIVEFLDDEDPAQFSWVERALWAAGSAVASDSMPIQWSSAVSRPDPYEWPIPPGGVTHPRLAGTYSRTLRLARESGAASLSEAIRRCTLIPAQVVEPAATDMRHKGRIQPGCYADVVVLDPSRVADRATYADPLRPAVGIVHVLVDGTAVVRNGAIVPDALPGRPVRGTAR